MCTLLETISKFCRIQIFAAASYNNDNNNNISLKLIPIRIMINNKK